LSQSAGQITHVLLTRSPLIHPRKGFSVRLACVKHAASVRPEPGSNSPTQEQSQQTPQPPPNTHPPAHAQQQPECQNKKPQNKTAHTVEFSKNTPTHTSAGTPRNTHPNPHRHHTHRKAQASITHSTKTAQPDGHQRPAQQ